MRTERGVWEAEEWTPGAKQSVLASSLAALPSPTAVAAGPSHKTVSFQNLEALGGGTGKKRRGVQKIGLGRGRHCHVFSIQLAEQPNGDLNNSKPSP